jgi:hypothetical protein
MTKPYYNVGEEVDLVGYGVYTITDRDYASSIDEYLYRLEGYRYQVVENDLRKKYTPSTKSFDELMYDLQ